MNNDILVGKIVNTFGIKGEVKILSDFEFKERIFKKGFKLYISEDKYEEEINSYRVHKNYDLITFKNYNNINEILKYKGFNVYIKRDDLKLNDDEYLLNDLIGLEVYDDDKLIGIVLDYEKSINNTLLKIKGDKTFYIPLISPYIIKVSLNDRKIITKGGSNLIL